MKSVHIRLVITFLMLVLRSNLVTQDQFKLLMFTHEDEWHAGCIPEAVQAFE